MRKRTAFLAHFSIIPLILFLGVCVFRLVFVFEIPNAVVIPSYYVLPEIIEVLAMDCIVIGGLHLTVGEALLLFWASGTAGFLAKYLREACRLQAALKDAVIVKNQKIWSIMEEIIAESGRKTKVRLKTLSWASSPMITGFFRPTVYLPAISFADAQMRGILQHEWTHFLHKDAWVKLFMCFLCGVFWWNPFVHILKKNLLHILELRCDAKLAARFSEEEKLCYLESMIKVMRHQQMHKEACRSVDDNALVSELIIGSEESNAEQRFRLLLEEGNRNRNRRMTYGIYVGIITLFLVSNIFVIQSKYECEEPGVYSINPEISYLVDNQNGTYGLYSEGEYLLEIKAEELITEPFASLPIK